MAHINDQYYALAKKKLDPLVGKYVRVVVHMGGHLSPEYNILYAGQEREGKMGDDGIFLMSKEESLDGKVWFNGYSYALSSICCDKAGYFLFCNGATSPGKIELCDKATLEKLLKFWDERKKPEIKAH